MSLRVITWFYSFECIPTISKMNSLTPLKLSYLASNNSLIKWKASVWSKTWYLCLIISKNSLAFVDFSKLLKRYLARVLFMTIILSLLDLSHLAWYFFSVVELSSVRFENSSTRKTISILTIPSANYISNLHLLKLILVRSSTLTLLLFTIVVTECTSKQCNWWVIQTIYQLEQL